MSGFEITTKDGKTYFCQHISEIGEDWRGNRTRLEVRGFPPGEGSEFHVLNIAHDRKIGEYEYLYDNLSLYLSRDVAIALRDAINASLAKTTPPMGEQVIGVDVCPVCHKEGGEYTPQLGECAFC